jgi:CheY-specific phosphatase CheX
VNAVSDLKIVSRTVLMTADAALEIASYVQIGNEFGQLQNVSWLTVTYVIAVTIAHPVVSKLR